MKIAPALVRATMLCVVILFGLLVVPIGFLSGFVGGVPDRFAAPFVEQWPLLKILWASNPGAAMQIMMQQPLMVIAHSEPASGVPVWRLFFYSVPLAVQLAVSVFAAVILCSGARVMMLRRFVSLLPGTAVLVFVTTYVQVASCCTGGPRWLIDILLYSLAYNTFDTLVDWHALYSGIAWALPIVQLALALFGVALLAVGTRRARHASAKTNPLGGQSGSSETPS